MKKFIIPISVFLLLIVVAIFSFKAADDTSDPTKVDGATNEDSIITEKKVTVPSKQPIDSVIVWQEIISNRNKVKQIAIAKLFKNDAGMKGKNVLITMGGMGAKLKWVQKWTEELFKAKLNEYNIGLIIAVIGPIDEYYNAKEINLTELTKKFVTAYKKYNLGHTYLIAHSSGVFPAHEMFDLLYAKGEKIKQKGDKKIEYRILDPKGITKNKINYIMLDGEIGVDNGYTFTDKMAENLKKIYSFYAIDVQTGTLSGMAHEAKRFKDKYPDKTVLFEYKAQNSGCNPGAKWCVHETLITTKPHNPAKFDLEKDYQIFGGDRKVVTSYMELVK